jgi:hypothetical protein
LDVISTDGTRCIDYKQHRDAASLSRALEQACPGGIDGYFENVGGMVLDAVMTRMNAFNTSRMKIQGFIVSEHMEIWPEALKELGMLVAAGKLRPRESVAQGIESAPEALLGLLKGRNLGKQLVKLV